MKFGVCTPVERAADAKRVGFEFVEAHVQNLLEGDLPDAQWKGMARVELSPLPVPAANSLVPPALKITGPEASIDRLGDYMTRIVARAERVGMKTLVFGSGAARMIPDGFDRAAARKQVLAFIRMTAALCARHGILLVAEPLNRGESNIMNSVAEAMEFVREINHPSFQCLVDSFHFWLEDEPLENLRAAMPWIRHVHVSDKTRVAPGESGKDDYRPFFAVLKRGGYDGLVSVEANGFDDIAGMGPRVLSLLKRHWAEA